MGRRKERKAERAIRPVHVSRKAAVSCTKVVTARTERNKFILEAKMIGVALDYIWEANKNEASEMIVWVTSLVVQWLRLHLPLHGVWV